MVTISKPITSPQGAGRQLQQTAASPFTSTVKGPPQQPLAQATPPAAAPAPAAAAAPSTPTDLMGMIPSGTQQTPDVAALSSIRAKMINELFNTDQGYAQRYASPESQDYIENPLDRAKVAGTKQTADLGLLSQINSILSSQREAKLSPTEQKQEHYNQLNQTLIQNPDASLQEVVQAYRPYLLPTEIINAYVESNPDKQITLSEAMTYGYKPQPGTIKAQQDFQRAEQAKAIVDRMAQEYQKVSSVWANIYRIPGLQELMGDVNPVAQYNKQRKKWGQDLSKLIYNSVFSSPARTMQENLPVAYTKQDIAEGNFSDLYAQIEEMQKGAQQQVPGLALGGSTNVSTIAKEKSNETAKQYSVQPITTSSGNTYTVEPGGL